MAFSTKAAGHFFSAAGKKIIDKSKYPIKKLKEFRDSEVAIQGSPKELAEKAAAIPFGMARTVGENTFRLKENPDSLLGFDINITGRAKAIAAAGIVGSAVFDIATMQTQNVGPTENGIKTEYKLPDGVSIEE